MANSHYQTPTSPRLYVSYPLFQYANGALDDVQTNFNGSEEDLIRMIQLDPSNYTSLDLLNQLNVLKYRILPQADDFTDLLESKLWNFNYVMILCHNFNSANAIPQIQVASDDGTVTDINTTNIINHTPFGVPDYDGFSIMQLQGAASNFDYNFRVGIKPQNVEQGATFTESPVNIGSILFGKYFDFPQNCDLSTTTTYNYGVKQKTTLSGKTISTANFTKPSNWITEPFGLGNQKGDNFQRKSGLRTWTLSFDSLSPEFVMNQNPMMNDNGFKHNFDNYSNTASNNSLYNINDGLDFYTTVVNKCMASHLPMVLQLDKNNPSPEQFAIVRMNSNYQIVQKTPNLYSIKLTLQEQV